MRFTRVISLETDSNDSKRDIISFVYNPQDLKEVSPVFYHIRLLESDSFGNDVFEVYTFYPETSEPVTLYRGLIQNCLDFAYFN